MQSVNTNKLTASIEATKAQLDFLRSGGFVQRIEPVEKRKRRAYRQKVAEVQVLIRPR